MPRSDEKFILDATAGFRMMWFNKKHPNCIYLDQRPECEPDIVGDFRDLKQFPDETFRLIVFDPPHIVKNEQGNTSITRMFGFLKPQTWHQEITQAAIELFRVLKPYGILFFKWSNQYLSTSEVLDCFPINPLVYQTTAYHPEKGKTHGRQRHVVTMWFTFMKFPEEAKN
jgi:hypothetical protein